MVLEYASCNGEMTRLLKRSSTISVYFMTYGAHLCYSKLEKCDEADLSPIIGKGTRSVRICSEEFRVCDEGSQVGLRN